MVMSALLSMSTRRNVENCFGDVNQKKLDAIFVKHGVKRYG